MVDVFRVGRQRLLLGFRELVLPRGNLGYPSDGFPEILQRHIYPEDFDPAGIWRKVGQSTNDIAEDPGPRAVNKGFGAQLRGIRRRFAACADWFVALQRRKVKKTYIRVARAMVPVNATMSTFAMQRLTPLDDSSLLVRNAVNLADQLVEFAGAGGDFAPNVAAPQRFSTFNRTQSPGARSYFQNHQPFKSVCRPRFPLRMATCRSFLETELSHLGARGRGRSFP